MIVPLTEQQRRLLGELAHIRTSPEDAHLGTWRLAQLVCDGNYPRAYMALSRLERRELVEGFRVGEDNLLHWRLTDKGRRVAL